VATAQAPDAKPLVQQGLERYQNGNFQGQSVLANSEHGPNSRSEDAVTILRYLGEGLSANRSGRSGDRTSGSTHCPLSPGWELGGENAHRKAQSHSSLGQHGSDRDYVVKTRWRILLVPKAAVWQLLAASQITGGSSSWGESNAHRLQGDYDEAIQYLQKSLAIAKKIANQTYVVSVLNNLGNTYASLAKRDYRRFQFANQADDQVAAQKFTSFAISYDGRAVNYFETSLALAKAILLRKFAHF